MSSIDIELILLDHSSYRAFHMQKPSDGGGQFLQPLGPRRSKHGSSARVFPKASTDLSKFSFMNLACLAVTGSSTAKILIF